MDQPDNSSPNLRPSLIRHSFNSRQSGDYVGQVRSLPTSNPIKEPLLEISKQNRVSSTENPRKYIKKDLNIKKETESMERIPTKEDIYGRITEEFNNKYKHLEEKLMYEIERLAKDSKNKDLEIDNLREKLKIKEKSLEDFENRIERLNDDVLKKNEDFYKKIINKEGKTQKTEEFFNRITALETLNRDKDEKIQFLQAKLFKDEEFLENSHVLLREKDKQLQEFAEKLVSLSVSNEKYAKSLDEKELLKKMESNILFVNDELEKHKRIIIEKEKIIDDLMIKLHTSNETIKKLELDIEQKNQVIKKLETIVLQNSEENQTLQSMILEKDANLNNLKQSLQEQEQNLIMFKEKTPFFSENNEKKTEKRPSNPVYVQELDRLKKMLDEKTQDNNEKQAMIDDLNQKNHELTISNQTFKIRTPKSEDLNNKQFFEILKDKQDQTNDQKKEKLKTAHAGYPQELQEKIKTLMIQLEDMKKKYEDLLKEKEQTSSQENKTFFVKESLEMPFERERGTFDNNTTIFNDKFFGEQIQGILNKNLTLNEENLALKNQKSLKDENIEKMNKISREKIQENERLKKKLMGLEKDFDDMQEKLKGNNPLEELIQENLSLKARISQIEENFNERNEEEVTRIQGILELEQEKQIKEINGRHKMEETKFFWEFECKNQEILALKQEILRTNVFLEDLAPEDSRIKAFLLESSNKENMEKKSEFESQIFIGKPEKNTEKDPEIILLTCELNKEKNYINFLQNLLDMIRKKLIDLSHITEVQDLIKDLEEFQFEEKNYSNEELNQKTNLLYSFQEEKDYFKPSKLIENQPFNNEIHQNLVLEREIFKKNLIINRISSELESQSRDNDEVLERFQAFEVEILENFGSPAEKIVRENRITHLLAAFRKRCFERTSSFGSSTGDNMRIKALKIALEKISKELLSFKGKWFAISEIIEKEINLKNKNELNPNLIETYFALKEEKDEEISNKLILGNELFEEFNVIQLKLAQKEHNFTNLKKNLEVLYEKLKEIEENSQMLEIQPLRQFLENILDESLLGVAEKKEESKDQEIDNLKLKYIENLIQLEEIKKNVPEIMTKRDNFEEKTENNLKVSGVSEIFSENEKLKNELEDYKWKIQEIYHENESFKTNIREISKENVDMKKEIQEKLDDLYQTQENLKESQSKIQENIEEINSLNQQISDLYKENDVFRHDNDSLKDFVSKNQVNLRENQVEIENLKKQSDLLNNKIYELSEKNEILEKDVNSYKNKLTDNQNLLQNLNDELDFSKKKIIELNESVDNLHKEIESFRNENQRISKEIENNREKAIIDREISNNRIMELFQINENLKKDNEFLHDASNKDKQILHENQTFISDLKKKLELCNVKLDESIQINEILKKDNESIKLASLAIQKDFKENENLLLKINDDLERLTILANEKSAENELLKSQNNSLLTENQRIMKGNEHLLQDNKNLKTEFEFLKENLYQSTKECQALKGEIDSHKTLFLENQRLFEENQTLIQENRAIKIDLRNFSSKSLEENNAVKAQIESDAQKNFSQERKRILTENQNLINENKKVKEEVENLTIKNNDFLKENEILKEIQKKINLEKESLIFEIQVTKAQLTLQDHYYPKNKQENQFYPDDEKEKEVMNNFSEKKEKEKVVVDEEDLKSSTFEREGAEVEHLCEMHLKELLNFNQIKANFSEEIKNHEDLSDFLHEKLELLLNSHSKLTKFHQEKCTVFKNKINLLENEKAYVYEEYNKTIQELEEKISIFPELQNKIEELEEKLTSFKNLEGKIEILEEKLALSKDFNRENIDKSNARIRELETILFESSQSKGKIITQYLNLIMELEQKIRENKGNDGESKQITPLKIEDDPFAMIFRRLAEDINELLEWNNRLMEDFKDQSIKYQEIHSLYQNTIKENQIVLQEKESFLKEKTHLFSENLRISKEKQVSEEISQGRLQGLAGKMELLLQENQKLRQMVDKLSKENEERKSQKTPKSEVAQYQELISHRNQLLEKFSQESFQKNEEILKKTQQETIFREKISSLENAVKEYSSNIVRLTSMNKELNERLSKKNISVDTEVVKGLKRRIFDLENSLENKLREKRQDKLFENKENIDKNELEARYSELNREKERMTQELVGIRTEYEIVLKEKEELKTNKNHSNSRLEWDKKLLEGQIKQMKVIIENIKAELRQTYKVLAEKKTEKEYLIQTVNFF